MNKIIMSNIKPNLCENIEKFGYEIIVCEKVNNLLPFECTHTDMQCLKIEDTMFVLKECNELYKQLKKLNYNIIKTIKNIDKKYPNNVLLNALYIKGKLYCKKDAIDKSVIDYCDSNNIIIVNVNQGYTKCSTAIIGDDFITSDIGIYNALQENGVEGILIKSGEIQLDGVNYGFIGGCCFSDEHNVYFTGDVTKYSDFSKIEEICYKNKVNIICLDNQKLYDIGGFVAI